MKAVIMAAGKGNRISRMIKNIPKSTLPINGKPLIRMTVEHLIQYGLEPVVIVGYGREKIYEALAGLDVKYYYNPFYEITNSIASLWFAKDELVGDTLFMNADVFVSEEILKDILEDERDNVMSIDVTRRKSGDYFFSTTDSGIIQKYGKDLPIEQRSCEYVGIAKVRESFIGKFKERLEELIDKRMYMYWWENVLYSFADSGEHPINTIDVKHLFWSEIDYFDDYERILNYISREA
ncbi:MAG: phosphocholine cytidylyltransferase family protein [Lachnospiraceae bacterium]|nr:phosphocholine cytidylyltransferase family protein [Lachnospiraceae bacterium]